MRPIALDIIRVREEVDAVLGYCDMGVGNRTSTWPWRPSHRNQEDLCEFCFPFLVATYVDHTPFSSLRFNQRRKFSIGPHTVLTTRPEQPGPYEAQVKREGKALHINNISGFPNVIIGLSDMVNFCTDTLKTSNRCPEIICHLSLCFRYLPCLNDFVRSYWFIAPVPQKHTASTYECYV